MVLALNKGQTVFFSLAEEIWNQPFVRKRSHICPVRSVILKGEVVAVKGDEFKARLTGNNGFEKDGQEFVFHKNTLLCDQNFKDTDDLGKWNTEDFNNLNH